MKIITFIFTTLFLLCTALHAKAQTANPLEGEQIWSLDAPEGQDRWVVIRDKQLWGDALIYHVEVLQRAKGQDPWVFERLSPHLVITEEALKPNLRKALKKGNVYPEAYWERYNEWKELPKGTQDMFICRSSIESCLQLK